MKLEFSIARRYFISRKNSNAVNLISWVSVAGILVGAGGLLLVLSVFNGFQGLVISLYNSFNPDFVIEATEGKSFVPDTIQLSQLRSLEGVYQVTGIIEENALLTYGNNQFLATIKGVDENYGRLSGIDSAIYDGNFSLLENGRYQAVLGYGVAQALRVNIAMPVGGIGIYIPTLDFKRGLVAPAGIFSIQSEFDVKYVFVPIELARELMGYTNQVSYIEVRMNKGVRSDYLQRSIQGIFGSEYMVKNRLQQNEVLYKVMKTEKWVVYAILTFILVVAAFNIIGSLSMLVIEKKKDISILKTMGAGSHIVQRIFLLEGILLSVTGCLAGFFISILLIFIQRQWGLIKIPGGTFVIDAYPVQLKFMDMVLVFATVLLIGVCASWFPSRRAARSVMLLREE